MHVLTSLILLVAIGLLLRFVSQTAKRLEFKKHSPVWIGVIWGVSIGSTLLFKYSYDAPLIIYILFSTGIATVIYLFVANADISGSLVFSISNTTALLAVMFYLGMLGGRMESTVTSGDVQLAADGVCQCATNGACLAIALPQMEKMILEAQVLVGNEAIVATNAVARARHCVAENPVTFEQENIVTFLEDWEKEVDKVMDDKPIDQKPSLFIEAELGFSKSNSNKVDLQKNNRQRVLHTPIATALDKKVSQTSESIESALKIDFQAVAITVLNKHKGDILRLTKSNGKVLNGWLIADEGSKIIIKQKLSGGYVQMPIAKASISLLEVRPANVFQ
jgi:hypothetical protein